MAFLLALLFYILAWVFLLYTIVSFFVFKGWRYPPYVPSLGKVKKTLLNEAVKILKKSKKSLIVADLGCGDGRLLSCLARQFPKHQFIGYEWNPLPYRLAQWRLKKYKNVQVIQADLMGQDLSHIDVAVCYWSSKIEFAQKLKKSMKKSAIVLSEIFKIQGWKIHKKVASRVLGFQTTVFVYYLIEEKEKNNA